MPKLCPVCKNEVKNYFEIEADESFTAFDAMDGLVVWGPFSAGKEVICDDGRFVHFRFVVDGEERLVEMFKPGELDELVEQPNYNETLDDEIAWEWGSAIDVSYDDGDFQWDKAVFDPDNDDLEKAIEYDEDDIPF